MSNLGFLVSQESLAKPHLGGCVGSMLIRLALGRLRQNYYMFKSSLVYIVNLGKPE